MKPIDIDALNEEYKDKGMKCLKHEVCEDGTVKTIFQFKENKFYLEVGIYPNGNLRHIEVIVNDGELTYITRYSNGEYHCSAPEISQTWGANKIFNNFEYYKGILDLVKDIVEHFENKFAPFKFPSWLEKMLWEAAMEFNERDMEKYKEDKKK